MMSIYYNTVRQVSLVLTMIFNDILISMKSYQSSSKQPTPRKKQELDKAVRKTVKQYRKTFELLAKT